MPVGCLLFGVEKLHKASYLVFVCQLRDEEVSLYVVYHHDRFTLQVLASVFGLEALPRAFFRNQRRSFPPSLLVIWRGLVIIS
jgi:hypothetical protein